MLGQDGQTLGLSEASDGLALRFDAKARTRRWSWT
jgi:hypothetical protein